MKELDAPTRPPPPRYYKLVLCNTLNLATDYLLTVLNGEVFFAASSLFSCLSVTEQRPYAVMVTNAQSTKLNGKHLASIFKR